MKVLHVPFCYYPDPVGGTEVYVASLARAQKERGIEATIAAPDTVNGAYAHDEVEVHRFAVGTNIGLRAIYGEGDVEAARNFAAILENARPDILHLHAFTSGVSLHVARAARERRIPVVFTYHTPTVTCIRGTMMRNGVEVCDGKMEVARCASCLLQGKGMAPAASRVFGSLPQSLGALAGAAGLSGGFWTALRATELVGLRHNAARSLLLEEADHIIAVCEWVRNVLLANGVPLEKITLSRQGVPYSIAPADAPLREARPLRFAYLGRLDPTKGVHILIEAFQRLPKIGMALDIFAVVQDERAKALHAGLLEKIGNDKRIRFEAPIPSARVVERLRSYDALLVPSQWLETGPLVVYEAFAAGIPVIGSHRGGIAELVTDGENGMLVPSASIDAWASALEKLAAEPQYLAKLKAAAKPVRTANDAAIEAGRVYAKVLELRH